MLRTRLVAVPIASLMTLGLVATGSGASVPAKTVSPKSWAKAVCPALVDFVETFQGINTQLAQASSAEEGQAIIMSGIDDSIAAADGVVKAVRRAGTPAAKKGKRAVATFTKEFTNIQDTLVGAQALVADLPVDDAEQFETDSNEIQQQVLADFGTSFERLDRIDRKLVKAIDSDSACAAIGG